MVMIDISINTFLEKYPEDEIKFDISQIKLVTIDIETAAEHGFPDVESAQKRFLRLLFRITLPRRLLLGV